MSHPFEVGKPYRNRNGEYVVQAIEGEWMKIKYESGGTIQSRISLQARIWENIQFEEQMAREEERQRLAKEEQLEARRRARPGQKGQAQTQVRRVQKGRLCGKEAGHRLEHPQGTGQGAGVRDEGDAPRPTMARGSYPASRQWTLPARIAGTRTPARPTPRSLSRPPWRAWPTVSTWASPPARSRPNGPGRTLWRWWARTARRAGRCGRR